MSTPAEPAPGAPPPLHGLLRRHPAATRVALLGGLLGLVGLVDYLSGPEISFSIFYLLPIAAAAWQYGTAAMLAFALLGAGLWLAADLGAGQVYSHPSIPVWNALVRLGLFTAVGGLILKNQKQMRTLQALSLTDAATGLANRRAFFAAVETELQRSRRYNRPLTLAYLDLDGFKAVNDRFGHQAGDQLLVEVARVLQQHLRAVDVAARLGGDEFALLLPETGNDEAPPALAKLRELLLQAMVRAGVEVTFSIGALTASAPVDGVQTLVSRADALMYTAKQAGKNRIEHRPG